MQTYHRLDDVQMRAIDREHAKAHMRSAELTIDFVADAVANTRSVIALVARHVMDVARRSLRTPALSANQRMNAGL